MQLGVDTLPEFPKDPGDRNRTSPFAFTGNRFEFRAVGSNQSVAGPLVAMNTILADSLAYVSDELEQKMAAGESLPGAAFSVLKQIMTDHGNVVFGGDGYSSEWHRIAVEERGLENLPTTADSLPVLQRPEVRDLFANQGVLTPLELESRFEVYAEQYVLAIDVEAKLAVQIARTQIYPAALRYLGELAGSLQLQSSMGLAMSPETSQQVAAFVQRLDSLCGQLQAALDSAPHNTDAHLRYSADTVVPLMDQLRAAVDGLEALVDDNLWPLPTYQEMLFIR
jgi:glutamine synthetase